MTVNVWKVIQTLLLRTPVKVISCANNLLHYNYNILSSTPDINECLLNSSLCGERRTCTNTPGGYNCSCAYGYKKNESNDDCIGIYIPSVQATSIMYTSRVTQSATL